MGSLNHMYKFFLLIFFELFFLVTNSHGDVSIKAGLIDNWSKYQNFGQISGVSVDKSGNVYVFHRGDRVWDANTFKEDNVFRQKDKGPIQSDTIVILSPETGAVIKQTGESLFYLPHGLTVDHENNIWVTDVALHQVFKFLPLDLNSNTSSLGKPVLTLGTAFEPHNDNSHFCKPTDVAVDKHTGDFFVSDGYCNSRIIKYDKSGKQLLTWGRPSPPFGKITGYTLLLPHALALGDDQKILFVADRQNQRIVAYNSTTGVYISEYAKDLNSPIFSVAYCPFHGGLLYALSTNEFPYNNTGSNKVAVYKLDNGQQLIQFYPRDLFSRAHDIALSPNGNASYVVDLVHNIWKFKLEFHDVTKPTTSESKDNSSFVKIEPTSLKDEDFLGGTNIAIALVTIIIAITLLIFLYHIQKRKGAYRRSEMRGLILDDDEDEGINLS